MTKDNILQTALRLFSVHGFTAVTMDAIAREVGIKAPSIYKHFMSKQDIFEQIVVRMDRKYMSLMASLAIDGLDAKQNESLLAFPEGILLDIGIAVFEFFVNDEDMKYFRRLLSLEQFRNEKLGKMYADRYFHDPLKYQSEFFRLMQKRGMLIEEEADLLALQYYAPLKLLISLCDLDPSFVPEAKRRVIEHFRLFNQMYRVKR